jgi:NADH-quinone oxidoreductase subunit M
MLLWLFLIPLISSLIIFAFPIASKRLAFVFSLIPLFLLIGEDSWIGADVDYLWIEPLSIHFHLSVDALSLIFLFLTAIIIPLSILVSSSVTITFPQVFYGLILLLQGLLIGFFTARDLALFTFFWEGMLIPLYFLISLWGGPQRRAAALKFLIYMIAGSALMIAAVLSLYFAASSISSRTFDIEELAAMAGALPHAVWIFAIFALAFAIKTPLFPFHGWLPDAYYEASTSSTILLSAILSKAGIYGFARIAWPLFPQQMETWSPLLLGLAIAGVLYAGLAAWMEKDFKRLIAYSSLSHVNFILAGLFVVSHIALSGALLQAFNHGITIAALFLVVDWLSIRLGSTEMNAGSGMCKYLPRLCWLTLFFVLSNVALPGTNSFIGEILILYGVVGTNIWVGALLGLSIILSVMYMLRWMQRVYFGVPSPRQEGWGDIRWRHLAIVLPLIFLILWVGLYPAPFLKFTQQAAEKAL